MNTQPIKRRSFDEDRARVHSMWPTIQGEGPFVGCGAIFLRLNGCNLQCPLCDTDYSSRKSWVSTTSLCSAIKSLAQIGRSKLVVITGGEPLLQPRAVVALSELLVRAEFRVQIETNGVLGLPDDLCERLASLRERVVVVVSPKTQKCNFPVHLIGAYKYVLRVGEISPDDGLPLSVLGNLYRVARPSGLVEVFVQPADEHNEERDAANLKATVDVCFRFGYRLSLQIHKLIGVE